ncbi:hypothetical protein BS636_13230 [Acinetobacter sp. LoGeW2-3]|uniref:hypothetical protein n=1 Tax=Acinetobacter sp. LoGeW2-3 TaxID=1808001 RepID=UPI000C05A887|nr:hypothetical protein [Acinetobacter sp. LoGeW2-3]ATO20563.1 hypothetical protein BS636_13230 [Acinetobacter sp. LoGeW2-3]
MIKIIISTILALIFITSGLVIYYWRDVQYDPTGIDMLQFFILLPVCAALLLLSPWLIYKSVKAYQTRKAQKLEAAENEEKRQQQQSELEKNKDKPVEELTLKIYSSAVIHNFGENQEIIEGMQAFKSPELDEHLVNHYGLPILSYRIKRLDDLLPEIEEDDILHSMRVQRINALIQQQLEQHSESLYHIAAHLRKSALFYDAETAYEYRMHPGWINEQLNNEENEPEPSVQQVARLNKLNLHILLPASLIHFWPDEAQQELLEQLEQQYEIVQSQIHVEFHYVDHGNAHVVWINLLNDIHQQSEQISLVMAVQSEIDQEWLEEQLWQSEQYLPGEYAASVCLASPQLSMEDLIEIRTIKTLKHVKNIGKYLQKQSLSFADQIEQEEPFVLLLDDPLQINTAKKVQQYLGTAGIELHHGLYCHSYLGSTAEMKVLFGILLCMQMNEDVITLAYSVQHPQTYFVYEPINRLEHFEQSAA